VGETVRMGQVDDTATDPRSRSVDEVDAPTLDSSTVESTTLDQATDPFGATTDAVTREHVTEEKRAHRCPECRQVFSGEARFCPFDGDALVDAPDWNPTADPLIGKTIDERYLVRRVLGEGGMGTIYEVSHTTLGRKFALKVLRRDIADLELNARFIQEAKAAASIGHPNIVAVNDFGTVEIKPGTSVPYFVMEHLQGETLADVLRHEPIISARRAAGLVAQCVSGLAAAHAAGVIHRDLKPDNIFLTRVADREFVKLLDFGVAKMVGAGRLTLAGTVFGTPHYMSPEQAGGHEVDHRADIYALGVILYECLSSRVPFEADTYMGVLTKHMFAAPEPIEQAVRDGRALGGLGPIVMRCLAKSPGERFATMEEVGAALELFLRDPKSAAASALGQHHRSVPDFSLRDAVSMEGRVSLPTPPVTRIWPKLVGVAVGLLGVAVVLFFVGAPSAKLTAGATASAVSTASAPPPIAIPQPTATAREVAPVARSTAAPSSASPSSAAAEAPSAAPNSRGPARRPAAPKPSAGRGGGPPPRDVVDPWAK
jgi:serine/threonine protein kinase